MERYWHWCCLQTETSLETKALRTSQHRDISRLPTGWGSTLEVCETTSARYPSSAAGVWDRVPPRFVYQSHQLPQALRTAKSPSAASLEGKPSQNCMLSKQVLSDDNEQCEGGTECCSALRPRCHPLNGAASVFFPFGWQ